MPNVEFKLVNGVDETTDNKLLPAGALKEATNVTIKKNGQAVPRDGFYAYRTQEGALIPTQIEGTINKAGNGYSYSRVVQSGMRQLEPEFQQRRVTENSRKGSQFGVARSAKSITAVVDDGEWVFNFDIDQSGSINIERLSIDGLEYEDHWSVTPKPSTARLAPYASISDYSDFEYWAIRSVYRLEDGQTALIYLTAYRPDPIGTVDRILGIVIKVDLSPGAPGSTAGAYWDIVQSLVDGDVFAEEDWRTRCSYAACTRGNGLSYFAINVGDSGGTEWWPVSSSDTVVLGPTLSGAANFGGGRIEADGQGRVWNFSDALAPRYVSTTDLSTITTPPNGTPGVSTPRNREQSKLLCDINGDGVTRGIYVEGGGLWVFADDGITMLYTETEAIGGRSCGNTVPLDDLSGYYIPVARIEETPDNKFFYLDLETIDAFNNANRQLAIYIVYLDGRVQLLSPVPGGNVEDTRNKQEVFLEGNDDYLDCLHELANLGATPDLYQFRLEAWEPVTDLLRDKEMFILGSSDIVTEGQALSVGSIWCPPGLSITQVDIPTVAEAEAELPGGVPGTFVQEELGDLRAYVVLEHTDLEGRTVRSAPAFGVVAFQFVAWELSEAARPGPYPRGRAYFGSTKFDFNISVPKVIDGTLVARVYVQNWAPVSVDNDPEVSTFYTVSPEIDTALGPFQEVASGLVESGAETVITWDPLMILKKVNNFPEGGNTVVYKSDSVFGAPIYTTAEVPNGPAPQGPVIGRTRERFFRSAYEGAKHAYASKLVQDSKKPEWSLLSAFRVDFPSEITGMGGIDTMLVVLTRRGVFAVRGDGPTQDGQGAFSSPQELPGNVGCRDYRSVLTCPDGVYFLSDQGIYLVNRGFGAPQWVGQALRGTITKDCVCHGATYTPADDTCRWSLENTSTGEFFTVAFDRRIGQWFVHEVTELPGEIELTEASGGAEPSEVLGLSISGGTGTLFKKLSGTGLGVEATVTTGELRMAGIDGHWQGRFLYLLGEIDRVDGESTRDVTVALSYNGKDFSKYVKTYDVANLDEGTCQLKLTLPIQRFDTLSIRVSWESALEGTFTLNGMTLYYDTFEYGARVGKGYRG